MGVWPLECAIVAASFCCLKLTTFPVGGKYIYSADTHAYIHMIHTLK